MITCIGSDHAPHTLAEKDQPYPKSPSGIPGVQTILPLLLTGIMIGFDRWQTRRGRRPANRLPIHKGCPYPMGRPTWTNYGL